MKVELRGDRVAGINGACISAREVSEELKLFSLHVSGCTGIKDVPLPETHAESASRSS